MTSKKNIIITGGSQGIGKACCELFHANNYQVINLDIAPNELKGIDYIQTDLSQVAAISESFKHIKEKYPRIDALISNAGIHFSASIENTSETDYFRVLNTNLTSCFFVLKETIQLMKQNIDGGRIVTIGSDQSFVAKNNSAVYGLTKAAIAQLTKNIALDYAKDHITANCVCPGTIETPLYWQAIRNYCQKSGADINAIHKEEQLLQPAKRLGQPEEVASLIYYLIDQAGSFLLGSNIAIDGGYTAQ
ncbi:MAG: SDR family oxidoreductase [Proteobacteria bacterium]|nr:SDR family oxidoreductase [Pseudomonadota bacterium]